MMLLHGIRMDLQLTVALFSRSDFGGLMGGEKDG